MKFKFRIIFMLMLAIGLVAPSAVSASESDDPGSLNVKEIIFHHLGDGYGWEVPFSHLYRIPLPVIVKAEDGSWHCFSSAALTDVELLKDEKTGEECKETVPVVHKEISGDKEYDFILAHGGSHSGKVVQIFSLSPEEEKIVLAQADSISVADGGNEHSVIVPGYVFHDGKYYREYKPLDLSITKNVLALFISAIIVILLIMSVVKWYGKNGMKAPRKGRGFVEMLVGFVYGDVIKPTLGKKARRFAPYLLTAFFFILTMNLVGLIVIFPGGANLTGNIAITMVLAILTFVITNVRGTKHYWKEIFWPDVPIWLKCPLPIMQIIEIFGTFTKPAALCVRLFANMMGGHMIVITLTVLIFIFAAFGVAVAGGTAVVSLAFSVFMLALDVLVSFIQAYVFTMLSTMFIAMAQEDGHHEHAEAEAIED